MVPLVGQEEEASTLVPKKAKVESTEGGSCRRRLKIKNNPSPYVPKTIPEAKVEEEEEWEKISMSH
jgi:hypothetical protein